MVGAEEHFATLEALKRLFRHFLQHSLHVAAYKCFYQKDEEKQKKVLFIPRPLAPAALHNISSCRSNGAVSVFLPLHHFYL